MRDLLHARLKNIWEHAGFVSDVTKPMLLEEILDNQVQELSGNKHLIKNLTIKFVIK